MFNNYITLYKGENLAQRLSIDWAASLKTRYYGISIGGWSFGIMRVGK